MKCVRSLVLLLTIVGITLLSGCGTVEKHPVGYNEIAALYGQPKESVVTALGIGDNLQEIMPGSYKLPNKAEYAGVPFDVYLQFDLGWDSKLFSVRYTAEYENDPEQAANNISAVANALSDAYGKTYVRKETVISEISQKDLIEKFTGETSFGENNFWDLTPSADENIKTLLETLGSSARWKESFSNPKLLPRYYMDFDVGYLPESDTSFMVIKYSISVYRGDGNYEETDYGAKS